MKNRLTLIGKHLMGANAPRIITSPHLARLMGKEKPVSPNTIAAWLRNLTNAGILAKVRRGLYANTLAAPKPSPSEAARHIRAGSVVSLYTVLGEAGVTNNYTNIVMAVVPIVTGGVSPSLGEVTTALGKYRFHGMPHKLIYGKGIKEAGGFQEGISYLKASPEKALLDWLYLAYSSRSWTSMPPKDIDISMLDTIKLGKLAKIMGMTERLERFLNEIRQYQATQREYEERETRRKLIHTKARLKTRKR